MNNLNNIEQASIQYQHQAFVAALSPLLGQREAHSVARIVFEDVFAVHNFKRQDQLQAGQVERLGQIQTRLVAGEPLQYILGQADFYGLQLRVDPSVLIPRPETEELVRWILEQPFPRTGFRVLDVGTGSGCIPLALKKHRRDWAISGLDTSETALATARQNAIDLELDVSFFQLDILQAPLPDLFQEVDLIVSNPPYIPPSEKSLMPDQVLDHEPHLALFVPEEDALLFYRRLAELVLQAKKQVALFVEINEHLGTAVQQLFSSMGLSEVVLQQDIQGKDRMVSAKRITN